MEKSISTQLFLFHILSPEILDIISKRFKIIELWAMGKHFPYKNDKFVMNIKKELDNFGIKAETAHLPIYIENDTGKELIFLGYKETNKKFWEEIIPCLSALEFLGVEIGIIHIGPPSDINFFVEEILKLSEKTHLKIAIENEPYEFPNSKTVLQVIEILKKIKWEKFGICADVGHLNIEKNMDFIKNEYIIATHISDNNGKEDQHLPPGKGEIDFKFIEDNLKNYKGNWTYEIADPSRGKYTIHELEKILLSL